MSKRRARTSCGVRYRHLRRRGATKYYNRDKILLRMGFASYRDYLKSDLWKTLRSVKLEIDPKCELCCVNRASQVHHMRYTYSCLKGKNPLPLVSICKDCHRKVEIGEDGKKRSKEAVDRITRNLLKKAGNYDKHLKPKRRKPPTNVEQPENGNEQG